MSHRRAAVLTSITASLLFASNGFAAKARNTVAISYFDNHTGKPELEVLSKGLADMLITDLSTIPSLQVVERARLNEVLGELKLSKSKFIDPKTAQKLGKGLAARYVMTGSYVLSGEQLRIDTRLIRVATGAVVASEKVEGKKDEFFALEKELVDVLVTALELKLGAADKMKLRSNPTQSFDAWSSYSAGLDAADKGDNARARELFEAALKSDPQYRAAKTASERLQAIFSQTDRATEGRADKTLGELDPRSPQLPQQVEQLLTSLDDKRKEQLARKIQVLQWLGERNLLPCPAPPKEPWPVGNMTVLSGGIPMGAKAISYCRPAHELLLLSFRSLEDPDLWDDVPKICEQLIHRLPNDPSVMGYCRMLLDDLTTRKKDGREAAIEDLKEDDASERKLPPEDWRRVLREATEPRRALLKTWAKNVGTSDTR